MEKVIRFFNGLHENGIIRVKRITFISDDLAPSENSIGLNYIIDDFAIVSLMEEGLSISIFPELYLVTSNDNLRFYLASKELSERDNTFCTNRGIFIVGNENLIIDNFTEWMIVFNSTYKEKKEYDIFSKCFEVVDLLGWGRVFNTTSSVTPYPINLKELKIGVASVYGRILFENRVHLENKLSGNSYVSFPDIRNYLSDSEISDIVSTPGIGIDDNDLVYSAVYGNKETPINTSNAISRVSNFYIRGKKNMWKSDKRSGTITYSRNEGIRNDSFVKFNPYPYTHHIGKGAL